MVVVGGITRLTHSGLSIVGAACRRCVSPLDESAWQEAFRKYQDTPQFRQVNPNMDLAGFRHLWWEYVHRLLGRSSARPFLLPLLWFAARGRISRRADVEALGFSSRRLQGAMGWYMVQSAWLTIRGVLAVSPCRAPRARARDPTRRWLWVALDLLYKRRVDRPPDPSWSCFALAGLVFVIGDLG